MLIKVDEAPQGWSYMAVDYEVSNSKSDRHDWVQKDAIGADVADLHRSLIEMGDQGWELVSVVPFVIGSRTIFKAIFKQPQFQTEPAAEVKHYTMPISRLKEELAGYTDDCEVTFGSGNLSFYRTKMRGDKLVQIEFNQLTDMVPDEP